MTDVLVPVLVSYARFLEVRARRLRVAAQLTEPAIERPSDIAAPSPPAPCDEQARAAVRVRATGPAAGVQQS